MENITDYEKQHLTTLWCKRCQKKTPQQPKLMSIRKYYICTICGEVNFARY